LIAFLNLLLSLITITELAIPVVMNIVQYILYYIWLLTPKIEIPQRTANTERPSKKFFVPNGVIFDSNSKPRTRVIYERQQLSIIPRPIMVNEANQKLKCRFSF